MYLLVSGSKKASVNVKRRNISILNKIQGSEKQRFLLLQQLVVYLKQWWK